MICSKGSKAKPVKQKYQRIVIGARQRDPAEPPACRHFTQMSESVSAQFSPGDSWEWFARTCHSKTGTVAKHHHRTMWHCFMKPQFQQRRETCMTKKITSHQSPLLLFFSYTRFMCEGIIIMVRGFTSATVLEGGE